MAKTAVQYLEEKVDALAASVNLLMTNHIPHLTADIVAIKADIDWIKKTYWVVVAGIVGVLIKLFIN